jgi:hypothetical protein
MNIIKKLILTISILFAFNASAAIYGNFQFFSSVTNENSNLSVTNNAKEVCQVFIDHNNLAWGNITGVKLSTYGSVLCRYDAAGNPDHFYSVTSTSYQLQYSPNVYAVATHGTSIQSCDPDIAVLSDSSGYYYCSGSGGTTPEPEPSACSQVKDNEAVFQILNLNYTGFEHYSITGKIGTETIACEVSIVDISDISNYENCSQFTVKFTGNSEEESSYSNFTKIENLDYCNIELVSDDDYDGDSVKNKDDAFPYDPNESKDSDNDGIGNNADTDWDNDGIPNYLDDDKDGDGCLDTNDSDPSDPSVCLPPDDPTNGAGNPDVAPPSSGFWTPLYEDGFSGLWEEKQTELEEALTPIFGEINMSASTVSYSIDFGGVVEGAGSLELNGNFFGVSVFEILGAFVMCFAGIAAFRIIFN